MSGSSHTRIGGNYKLVAKSALELTFFFVFFTYGGGGLFEETALPRPLIFSENGRSACHVNFFGNIIACVHVDHSLISLVAAAFCESGKWRSVNNFITPAVSVLRATSHTRLGARDHYISSTLIGGKGAAGRSKFTCFTLCRVSLNRFGQTSSYTRYLFGA